MKIFIVKSRKLSLRFVGANLISILTCLISSQGIAASLQVQKANLSNLRYTVRADDTLRELSILFYGKPKYWRRLALSSQLKPPYHLIPGSVLVLPQPRRLTQAQGEAALLAYHRRRLAQRDPWGHRVARPEQSEAAQVERESSMSRAPRTDVGPAVPSQANEVDSAPQVAPEVAKQAFESSDATQTLSLIQAQEEWTAEVNYRKGTQLFEAGQAEAALAFLTNARTSNSEESAHWISEIRCLQKLNKTDRAKELAQKFIIQFPDLEFLPNIQAARDGKPWVETAEH
jgi:hypothetical protein